MTVSRKKEINDMDYSFELSGTGDSIVCWASRDCLKAESRKPFSYFDQVPSVMETSPLKVALTHELSAKVYELQKIPAVCIV